MFLDVDGVLNCHEWDEEVRCGRICQDRVRLLNRVLRETGAVVVLSSAWRYILHRGESNLAGLDWLLRSHGFLAGRLVGVTRPDTMVRGLYDGTPGSWPRVDERGEQITAWLEDHRNGCFLGTVPDVDVWRYAAVDDLDLGITAAGHPLVQTDGRVGLTRADADRLAELLSE